MSRTWTTDYQKLRPGMPPGRFALAMWRLRRRRRTEAERKAAIGQPGSSPGLAACGSTEEDG